MATPTKADLCVEVDDENAASPISMKTMRHNSSHDFSERSALFASDDSVSIKLDQKKTRSRSRIAAKLFAFILVGFFFGWSLQKGMVYEPKAIRLQFVFESFDMLKIFLSAAAAGQLIFFVMYFSSKSLFEAVRDDFLGCIECKGIVGVTLGAAMLGAGMALGGGCPGMVLAQVGSGVPYAYVTLIGCFAGALIYGLLEGPLLKIAQKGSISDSKYTLEGLLRIKRVPIVLGATVTIFIGAVVLIEILWPWSLDMDILIPASVMNETSGVWGSYGLDALSWPPYLVGAIIGLLQLPVDLLVTDSLGSSTSYMLLVSQWVHALPIDKRRSFPNMARLAEQSFNPEAWWQVIYVTGAVIGAFVSAHLSVGYGHVANGVFPAEAFFGGVLMLFGSRLASGCTSGHGLSGMALLATLSFLAVPAMFAGGIITAFSMKAAGNLVPQVTPLF
mmetsp:Transcript_4721/g.9898  ORF Transcript_4721/g.9898 Transcript_4721/m.9898 type:complete len:446 (-) Transcript_4721:1327-2664(-)